MAASDDCGCCAGAAARTPAARNNAPGLPTVGYRVGNYAEFRATMLARLSSTDFPALAALTTRAADDWTIALTDAFACVADILTFYQERIANESWLRTAAERRSVLELAGLIGYRLAPGVAASASLAFTLEAAPGQKALAARPVTIPAGSRVLSVPDADQAPQSFETTSAIVAHSEWNAMAAQTGEKIEITAGLTELYIEGSGSQMQPGDAILIAGGERLHDPASPRWALRWIEAIEPDTARGITRLSWSDGLDPVWDAPSAHGAHIYVFRQRASLFGAQAADPNLIANASNAGLFTAAAVPGKQWLGFSIDTSGTAIDLDASYPKIVRHSWVALAGGSGGTAPTGLIELYRVAAVTQLSRSAFGLSAKVTRLQTDGTQNLDKFGLRATQVLAQSETLTLAQRPLLYPVFGSALTLGVRAPGLQPGQMLALSGKRQRVRVPANTGGISFSDGRVPRPGSSFTVMAPPQVQLPANQWQTLEPQQLDPRLPASGVWRWPVLDAAGAAVSITAPAGSMLLQPALDGDDLASETASIAQGADGIHLELATTRLTLSAPVQNCYDRATLLVNANVAPATHGESVGEIGGSGDAAQANQAFVLKQAPLTYVPSGSNPSGGAATLQVRVGGVLWAERPTLYGTGPRDRVYALRQSDTGVTTVTFGDGAQGARLPSAQNNVRFAYRKGLGAAGNLRTGQLSMLLSRPLGVKGVSNPDPSSGGQDPETLDRARRNAPLRMLTLGRAVSAQDYADFARTFAGIEKATATWSGRGPARGIAITIAGSGGSPIPPGSSTQTSLLAALRAFGDRLLPLTLHSYGDARFTLRAAVKTHPDYESARVLAAVEATLRAAFSFEARAFGQPVTLDELYAVVQSVPGVIASTILRLYRIDTGPLAPQPQPRLIAALGGAGPAELLSLDPGKIALGHMP